VELERKKPQKVPARERTQPPRLRDQLEVTIEPNPSEPGTGTGTGEGPGQGPGDGDGPPAADPCEEPSAACGTKPLPVPPLPDPPRPPPVKVHAVTPRILRALRTSGKTAIHPPRDVFQQMHRAGDLKTSASILVCLAADGAVSSVTLTRSTRYPAYDEAITGAARRWRYKPYTVNGTPVPACGMVTFVYEMK
jgi:protein TonB